MVKADVKRDYYADLELQYGATSDEVKKQFRKLAKLYHPDRNPGREVEFNAKFQSIQAANEILGDPESKMKYDQDRLKAGYVNIYSTPSRPNPPPPRTNAPATSSTFPRQPRRGAWPPPTPKNSYPIPHVPKAPPSAGAQRYAPFAKAGAQSWEKTKAEAQTRADAFRGFQEMKNGPGRGGFTPQQPPPPPPPPRGRATGQRPADSFFPPPPPDPKPTKSWDRFPPGPSGFPGMSQTQSTRRRQGFDPSTPGDDEHMAGTSAYTGVSRGGRPSVAQPRTSYFDNIPSPTSPQAKPVPSPLRHTRSHDDASQQAQRPGVPRQSTKYATSGGEKTNVFTSGLGRSASMRNSPVDQHYEDHKPSRPHSHHGHPRFRSASPGTRMPTADPYYSDSSSESSSEEPIYVSTRPKANAHQQTARTMLDAAYRYANTHPTADDAQFQNHDTPQQEHTASSRFPPQQPSDDDAIFPSERSANSTQNHQDATQNEGSGEQARKTDPNLYDTPSHSFSRKWSKEWGFTPREKGRGESSYGIPLWALPSSVSPEVVLNSRKDAHLEPILEDKRFDRDSQEPKARNANPTSVKSSEPCSTADNRLNCSSDGSASNIPGTFSASEWNGKFASAEDLFAPMPTRGRHSPVKQARNGGSGSTPTTVYEQNDPASGSEANASATAFQPPRFDADKWAEDLKGQTWSVPKQDHPKFKTPKRGSRSTTKRPLHARSTRTNSEDTTSDVGGVSTAAAAEKTRPLDGDEMDIDSPANLSPPAETNGAPTHPTEPQDHPTVNLNDFRHVHPFKPSNTGLGDLEDLSSSLPFESRAAQEVTSTKQQSILQTVKELKLPKPPKAPIAPMEESLSPGRWMTYSNHVNSYMKEWSRFNREILEHFAIRQARVEHNMAQNWISSVGDGPEDLAILEKGSGVQPGYKTYMSWMEQDMQVREWWNVACDKHAEAMRELGVVREKMKAGNGRPQ